MVARLATARTVDDGPLRFTSIFYFARPHCLINITRDSDTVTRPSVRLSVCHSAITRLRPLTTQFQLLCGHGHVDLTQQMTWREAVSQP